MGHISTMRDSAARSDAPRTSAGGSVIPWYASGMTAKRKVSVSLDAEHGPVDETLVAKYMELL